LRICNLAWGGMAHSDNVADGPKMTIKTDKLDAAMAHLAADRPLIISTDINQNDKAAILDLVLAQMSQGICLYDKDQRVIFCNARFLEIYDLPREQVRPGMSLEDILRLRIARGHTPDIAPEDYIRERVQTVDRAKAETIIHHLQDKRVVAIGHKPVAGGGWMSTHEDITELYAYRRAFTTKLDDVLEAQQPFTLLSLDLDGLKTVNDTLGHSAGDEILKQVSVRISACIRRVDMAARLGGDEFVIIQPGRPKAATALATRLLETLSAPIDLDQRQAKVSASIGIAIASHYDASGGPADPALAAPASPDLDFSNGFGGSMPFGGGRLEQPFYHHNIDADELLRQADMAMYDAKRHGGNRYQLYELGIER